MDFRFDIIYEYRWMFLYGALTTLGLTVVATAGGSVLGLLLALARLIKLEKAGAPMRVLAWALRKFSLLYVTLFRGTPLFVQIVIWAYVWFPFFVHPSDGICRSKPCGVFTKCPTIRPRNPSNPYCPRRSCLPGGMPTALADF